MTPQAACEWIFAIHIAIAVLLLAAREIRDLLQKK